MFIRRYKHGNEETISKSGEIKFSYIRKQPCICCRESGMVTVDHIHEKSDGGSSKWVENLQPLCMSCHRQKTFLFKLYRERVLRHRMDKRTAAYLNDIFLQGRWQIIGKTTFRKDFPSFNNIKEFRIDGVRIDIKKA